MAIECRMVLTVFGGTDLKMLCELRRVRCVSVRTSGNFSLIKELAVESYHSHQQTLSPIKTAALQRKLCQTWKQLVHGWMNIGYVFSTGSSESAHHVTHTGWLGT